MLGELAGQGWLQIGELALAFVLSSLIGLEREIRQKSAGLRTYTLVGFASALIILISKYGFTDILVSGQVVLDPSRIAAQIVSGIGFIGGGVIFVRRDAVRGLTTAATVWLTAAVGMACGAGLPILAVVVTAGHFIVIFVFRRSNSACQDPDGHPPCYRCRFSIAGILSVRFWRPAPGKISLSAGSGSSAPPGSVRIRAKQPAKSEVGPDLGDSPRDLGFTERIVTVMLAVSGRSIDRQTGRKT